MTEDRKPVRLDLAAFRPKPAVSDPSADQRAIVEARRLGFGGRDEPFVDGRSLRRKGKVQLNLKVRPETRRMFMDVLANFEDADAALTYLLSLDPKSER